MRLAINTLLIYLFILLSYSVSAQDIISLISDPNLNAKAYTQVGQPLVLSADEIYEVTDLRNAYNDLVSNNYLEDDALHTAQFVIVSHSRQAMFFFNYGEVSIYLISTAENGLGEATGSLQTPRGVHRIKNKIGEGLPKNAILKGRVFTGVVWSQDNRSDYEDDDLVLSRVLWLDGLERRNSRSHARYIYFHGTNHPEKLGTPASHGCIRMGEDEVIEFFEQIEQGAIVKILEV